MQLIELALKELRKFFLLVNVSALVLDSVIVFLAALLFTTVFRLFWGYALAPTVVAVAVLAERQRRKNIYLDVEEKVPGLREQLRTAVDNLYRDNFVVNLLKMDVVRGMRKVKTSYFIDDRNLFFRVMGVVCLGFLILTVAYFNVGFDYGLIAEKLNLPREIGVWEGGKEVVNVGFVAEEGNLSEIFGNRSLAVLGKEELRMRINPLQSEIDITDVREVEGMEEFGAIPRFPKEIYTSYDMAYSEKIPKENRDIIKRYFKSIAW